jgi:hypothetical protein
MKAKGFTGSLRVVTGWKTDLGQNCAALTEKWQNG